MVIACTCTCVGVSMCYSAYKIGHFPCDVLLINKVCWIGQIFFLASNPCCASNVYIVYIIIVHVSQIGMQ